jgi:phospholipid transport system substrate-binding protein
MTAHVLNRRSLFATTAVVLVYVAHQHHARADSTAVAPIYQLTDGLARVMKAGRATPFSRRFDVLAPVIDQTFALDTILKASVGTTWGTLPLDQRVALVKAFRRYTVASYVNGFEEDNQHFVVNPEPRIDGDEQIVRIRIIPNVGDEYKLDHVMQRGPAGWRVVDILADGAISRVAVQRSDFRQLIRRGGVPALVQSLDSKSADLSD